MGSVICGMSVNRMDSLVPANDLENFKSNWTTKCLIERFAENIKHKKVSDTVEWTGQVFENIFSESTTYSKQITSSSQYFEKLAYNPAFCRFKH